MKKRILAILMAVMMLGSVMPVDVLAEGDVQIEDRTEAPETILGKGFEQPQEIILSETDKQIFQQNYQNQVDATGSAVYNHDWDKYSSNYFYNLLNESEQRLWDGLDEVHRKYLSSNVTATSCDSENQVYFTDEVAYTGMSEERAKVVAWLFRYSNPQYYFCSNWYSNYSYENTNYFCFGIYDAFREGTDRAKATSAVKAQIDEWQPQINAQTSVLDKEKVIHDLINEKVTYAENMYDQSAYSVLCDSKTVCAGYAQTFALLCNGAGIDTIAVTSSNHEWNQICINDSWYNVDCTWDDTYNRGASCYRYMNRSTSAIQSTTLDSQDSHYVESTYSYMIPACTQDTASSIENVGELPQVNNTVENPVFTYKDGDVSISCSTQNAKIYYTINSTLPSVSATKCDIYSTPFTVPKGTIINAIAVADQYWDSQIVTLNTSSYQVTFDSRGGSDVASQSVEVAGHVTKPADPTYESYVFTGWYTDADCTTGNEWNFAENTVNGDMTLYAGWEEDNDNYSRYTVEYYLENLLTDGYELQGDDGYTSARLPVGSAVEAIQKEYEGYSIDNSAAGSCLSGKIPATTEPQLVLKVYYSRKRYDVAYNLNDHGTAIATQQNVKHGATIAEPTEPQETDYIFKGWYTDANCSTGNEWEFATDTVTSTMTLYAKWVRVKANYNYTVKYYLQNLEDDDYTLTYTQTLSEADGAQVAVPERNYTGYTIYESAEGSKLTGSVRNDESLELRAYYTRNLYRVTCHIDNEDDIYVDVKYQAALTAPPEPERTGYTFAGWYTDANCSSGNEWDFATDTVTADMTLYAKWNVINYTITYYLNGGTQSAGQMETYNITTMNFGFRNPSRTGYSFAGWYTNAGLNNRITQISYGTIGNKTLYAKWTPTTYTIAYNLNGGTQASGQMTSYNITSATFSLKNPTRKGYTFAGWYTTSNFKTKVTSIASGTTDNKVLYAKWTKVTVKKATISKLTNKSGKKLAVSTKKVSGAAGYQIQYSTSKKFTKKTTKSVTVKGTSKTITKLKKNKTYYVRVRAYKKDSKGNKVYGSWSKVKTKKITK